MSELQRLQGNDVCLCIRKECRVFLQVPVNLIMPVIVTCHQLIMWIIIENTSKYYVLFCIT